MDYGIICGTGIALLSLCLIAYVVDKETSKFNGWVEHTLKVQAQLTETLSVLQDLETGQRGYVLTGKKKYLEPFNSAYALIDQHLSDLKYLIRNNTLQQRKLEALVPLIAAKIKELKETVLLRETEGLEAARVLIETDIGKEFMDQMRVLIQGMSQEEEKLLVSRKQSIEKFKVVTRIAFISATFLLVISTSVILFFRLRRAQQEADKNKVYADLFKNWKASDFIGIIQSNDKGGIIDANDYMLAMLGYSKKNLKDGTLNWAKLTPPEFSHLDMKALKEASDKGFWSAFEKEYIHKDGHRVPILIGGSRYRNDPNEFVVFVIDITGRKRLEKQIRRSQKMEAIGELTSGVAHDFNNILSIVQGNFEILKRMFRENDKALQRIDIGLKATSRGANLTRKLLNFSSKGIDEAISISINKEISGWIELIAKSLTTSINVEYRLCSDVWTVKVECGDFQDALLNLSINARDAMPDGGNLIIETKNCSFDKNSHLQNSINLTGDYVLLSMSDNGCGMSNEIMDRALEPFFSTKERNKGTGLGLSVAYGFVQRSGGHIEIVSEVNRGTTIHIYLPRSHTEITSIATIDEGNDLLFSNTETILVVEDEEDLRNTVTMQLEEIGFKVIIARDGEAAMEILENGQRVDLLFTDIIIPGDINGFKLAILVHKQFPELKVLLTSGFAEKPIDLSSENSRYISELDKNLLHKPYDKLQLSNTIRRALNG